MIKFIFLLFITAFVSADDVVDLSDYSSSDFKSKLENYDVALVEFYAPWCGHCKRLAPEYARAASELKSNDPSVPLVKVDCTSDLGKDNCQENGVNGYPTLKIFKNGEFAQEYQGPRDADGIVKYMKAQAGPASKEYKSFADLKERLANVKDVVVVGVFSSDSDELAKKFHKTADYVKNPKGTNYWRNRILKVAKEIGSKDVNYAVSNNILFGGELEEFGMDSKQDLPVVAARDKNNKKYIMQEKFSVDALKKFVEDFLAGNLEPFVKSEDLPENNDGPVKVAVGKNFEELVMNNKKDVFIEFYAPWCGHCKNLQPIYEELGKAMENEPTIEIVKMDATANDVSGPFQVHGFPTLFFLPSDSKVPKKYEGGRELEDFISYIAKYSTEELKGYTRDGKARKDEL